MGSQKSVSAQTQQRGAEDGAVVEGKAVLVQRRADDVLAKGRIAAFGAHRSMEDFPTAGQRQVNQSLAFLCMDIEPARVRGIVIGVLMLRLIFVGLNMIGINQDLFYIIKGGIILFACALDMRKYLVKR